MCEAEEIGRGDFANRDRSEWVRLLPHPEEFERLRIPSGIDLCARSAGGSDCTKGNVDMPGKRNFVRRSVWGMAVGLAATQPAMADSCGREIESGGYKVYITAYFFGSKAKVETDLNYPVQNQTFPFLKGAAAPEVSFRMRRMDPPVSEVDRPIFIVFITQENSKKMGIRSEKLTCRFENKGGKAIGLTALERRKVSGRTHFSCSIPAFDTPSIRVVLQSVKGRQVYYFADYMTSSPMKLREEVAWTQNYVVAQARAGRCHR